LRVLDPLGQSTGLSSGPLEWKESTVGGMAPNRGGFAGTLVWMNGTRADIAESVE